MATRKRSRMVPGLAHLDERGAARMVDVGAKPSTHRVAVAEAWVKVSEASLERLAQGTAEKGDTLAVVRLAGIQAAKRTADLIPLAHPLLLTHVAVDIQVEAAQHRVRIEARAETVNLTGVELEAMVAASTAALTLYDMLKSHDRGMVIERVQLVMKSGGRSGTYRRAERKGETEVSEISSRPRRPRGSGAQRRGRR